MFKFVSLIAVAALSMTTVAHAETASKFYGHIGYARTTLGSDNTFNAVSVGGGTAFNKYFGAEVEGAFGISETDLNGIDMAAKLDYSAGAYLTGTYPIATNVDLTGRIGYSKTQISIEYMGYKVSDSVAAQPWALASVTSLRVASMACAATSPISNLVMVAAISLKSLMFAAFK